MTGVQTCALPIYICQKWEKKHPELVPIYGNRLLKYRYEESAL